MKEITDFSKSHGNPPTPVYFDELEYF